MDIRSFFGSTKKPSDKKGIESTPTVAESKPSSSLELPKFSSAHPKGKSPVKPKPSGAGKVAKHVKDDDEDFDILVDSDDGEDEDYNSEEESKRKKLKASSRNKTPVKKDSKPSSGIVHSNTGPTASKYFNDALSVVAPKSPLKTQPSTSFGKIESPKVDDIIGKRAPSNSSTQLGSAKKQKIVTAEEFFGNPTGASSSPQIIAVENKKDTAIVLDDKKSPKKRSLPTTVADPHTAMKKTVLAESSSAPTSVVTGGTGLYFDNMRIGVTGIFQRMSRESVEEYILENGGKIAASISGKTSLLVIGYQLDDGREVTSGNKYKTAIEKKVTVMNEEEFFSKYDPTKKPSAVFSQPLPIPATPTADGTPLRAPVVNEMKQPFISASKGKSENVNHDVSLWVDRYKPQTPNDLIGHAEIVRKLQDWLRNWDAVHIKKSMKVAFSKENPGAKAVLLSGPPGIGKSSVAGIMAKAMGFDILELNASDTRNKREIEEKLIEAVSTKAISSQGLGFTSSTAANGKSLGHRLVIMDEVDGMGGSDRGGIAELIKIIKQSKIPIICICNDRQSPKVKSLANHCFDLRVKRPMKAQIANRLIQIAATEGLQVEQNAAQMLVEQSGNDIRQALNALQMWSYSSKVSVTTNQTNYMSYQDMKQGIGRIEKDKVLRQNPFDACGIILGGEKRHPWDDRYNSFFIDYSLVPLLIQQNYIDAAKNGILRNPQLSELEKLEALSKASDAVSDIDMVGSKIRGQDQHWELLPTQAVFCMAVGNPINGFQEFPSFPAWLGKYSSTNKKNRLTRELVHHSSLSIGQGFLPMRMDYVPYLRSRLLHPLLTKGKEGVRDTVGMLELYGFTKDDFMESMKDMQFVVENNKIFADRYEQIDTQTKTALTKYYNNAGIKSGTVVPEIGGLRKTKKAKSNDDLEEELLEDEDEAIIEEPQEDEEEEDVAALRAQLSNKAKSSKSAKAGTQKSDASKATKGRKK